MKYSQNAVNDYQKRNYYKVSVNFPKEYKEQLQEAARGRGVSVSRMITEIVGQALGMDLVLDGVLDRISGSGAGQAEE